MGTTDENNFHSRVRTDNKFQIIQIMEHGDSVSYFILCCFWTAEQQAPSVRMPESKKWKRINYWERLHGKLRNTRERRENNF